MISLTFGMFTQVSGSGPLGPLVLFIGPTVNIGAYQFSPPAKHVHNMQ